MHRPDSRLPTGRGYYETRLLSAAGALDKSAPIAKASSQRVALVFVANFGVPTIADFVAVGPKSGGSVLPLRVLTAGIPHCTVRIETDGDVLWGEWYASGSAGFTSVTVYEVVFHPEDV